MSLFRERHLARLLDRHAISKKLVPKLLAPARGGIAFDVAGPPLAFPAG